VSGAKAGRYRIRQMTSVHNVDDTRILHKECKSLARAGHDVALLACHDHDETLFGVPIVALEPPRNRFDRATRVAWNFFQRARRERADVYHLHDPELLWVGFLLKLTGHTVVYDAHEDVPEQIKNKFWVPPWAKWILSTGAMVAETVAAKVLDAIVVATPTIAEKFPPEKTVVVQNFPESQVAQTNGEARPFGERRHAFVYTGGITEAQAAREMMEAFAQLPEGMTGTMAGRFDQDALEADVRASEGWKRVDYLGQVSRDGVMEAIRSARVGVVVDRGISNYLDAYSTKMFEYMACGVPVVASNFPLWVRLMTDADCGVLVDPTDTRAIAAAIARLAQDPEEAGRLGENGRQAILTRFNWEHEVDKLEGLYRRLA
jgi:glycosyltransferase involved in cell wall biosynthesis